MANVFSHTIHKFMEPSVALSDVYRTDSIIIFRVPEVEGSEAAKETRKKAVAEELKRKQALYGKHYYNSYGTPVENEEDVAICLTGRSVSRASGALPLARALCMQPLCMLHRRCASIPTLSRQHGPMTIAWSRTWCRCPC